MTYDQFEAIIHMMTAYNRLSRENARLRAMLKRLEWSRNNHFCPICDEHHEDGHQASCELAALLKEAAGD